MISNSPENKSLNNKALSNKFWENIIKKTPNKSLSTPITTRENEINRHSQPIKSRTS